MRCFTDILIFFSYFLKLISLVFNHKIAFLWAEENLGHAHGVKDQRL